MIDVQTLKINIIKLGIRGELTSGFSSEKTGDEALNQAIKEKDNAYKSGLIRKEKKGALINDEELPFDIPDNWAWARLSDISSIESGGTPDRSIAKYWNGNIPWLKIGDLKGKYVSECSEYITLEGLNNSSAKIFKKGTMLYTIFATIGNVSILDFESSTNQAIAGITFYGGMNTNYLYYVLIGLKDILVGKSHGMTQANINQTILKNTVIPIPPIDEQESISKKLDELFDILDKVETAQKDVLELRDGLERKVINLALKGKLVEQKAEEGNANDLLKKIKKEKQDLIKAKILRNEKPLNTIEEDEIPFVIPSSWVWVRLGDLGSYKKGPFGSALTKSMFVPKSDNSVKVYEQKNAIQKDWHLGDYFITKEYYLDQMQSFEVGGGDIIVSCAGTIGETYVLPDDAEEGIINQALMRIRLSQFVDVDYYLMYFDAILKGAANDEGKGTAIKNIPPFDILKNMLFALPPYEEQKRIVSRVKELINICDLVA